MQLYVEAINTPGVVPSVQSAWDTFVGVKCTEASQAALTIYDSLMKSGLSGRLPCDNDVIRQNHDAAFEKGVAHLEDETSGLSAVTTEKVMRELTVSLVNIYNNVSPWLLRQWREILWPLCNFFKWRHKQRRLNFEKHVFFFFFLFLFLSF